MDPELNYCPVCLEVVTTADVDRWPRCGHQLHTGCMAQYIEAVPRGAMATCPLCRIDHDTFVPRTPVRRNRTQGTALDFDFLEFAPDAVDQGVFSNDVIRQIVIDMRRAPNRNRPNPDDTSGPTRDRLLQNIDQWSWFDQHEHRDLLVPAQSMEIFAAQLSEEMQFAHTFVGSAANVIYDRSERRSMLPVGHLCFPQGVDAVYRALTARAPQLFHIDGIRIDLVRNNHLRIVSSRHYFSTAFAHSLVRHMLLNVFDNLRIVELIDIEISQHVVDFMLTKFHRTIEKIVFYFVRTSRMHMGNEYTRRRGIILPALDSQGREIYDSNVQRPPQPQPQPQPAAAAAPVAPRRSYFSLPLLGGQGGGGGIIGRAIGGGLGGIGLGGIGLGGLGRGREEDISLESEGTTAARLNSSWPNINPLDIRRALLCTQLKSLTLNTIVVPSLAVNHWTNFAELDVFDIKDYSSGEFNQLLAQVVRLPSIARISINKSEFRENPRCLNADTLYHLVTFVSNVRVRTPPNAHLKLNTCASIFNAQPSWWLGIHIRLYGSLLTQLLDNAVALQSLTLEFCYVSTRREVIEGIPRLRAAGVQVQLNDFEL